MDDPRVKEAEAHLKRKGVWSESASVIRGLLAVVRELEQQLADSKEFQRKYEQDRDRLRIALWDFIGGYITKQQAIAALEDK